MTDSKIRLASPSSVIQICYCDERSFGHPCYKSGYLAYVLNDCIRILNVVEAAETEVVVDIRRLFKSEALHHLEAGDPQGRKFATELMSTETSRTLMVGSLRYEKNFLTFYTRSLGLTLYCILDLRLETAPCHRVMMIKNWPYENQSRPLIAISDRYLIFAALEPSISFPDLQTTWIIYRFDLLQGYHHPSVVVLQVPYIPRSRFIQFRISKDSGYILQRVGMNQDLFCLYRFSIDDFTKVSPVQITHTISVDQLGLVPVHPKTTQIRLSRREAWTHYSAAVAHDWMLPVFSGGEGCIELSIRVDLGWWLQDRNTIDPLSWQIPIPVPSQREKILVHPNEGRKPHTQIAETASIPESCSVVRCKWTGRSCLRHGIFRGNAIVNLWRSTKPTRCPPFYLTAESLEYDSKGHYTRGPLHLFPPQICPRDLLELLFPPQLGVTEWPLQAEFPHYIYIVSPYSNSVSEDPFGAGFSDRERSSQLMLINFNPWTRFKGLKTLHLSPVSELFDPDEIVQDIQYQNAPATIDIRSPDVVATEELRQAGGAPLPGSVQSSPMERSNAAGADTDGEVPWLRTEKAMWTYERKGFQFT